jgi:hypothetical protein
VKHDRPSPQRSGQNIEANSPPPIGQHGVLVPAWPFDKF